MIVVALHNSLYNGPMLKKQDAPLQTPFQQMQAAVDIVHTSEHPHNKVAATLFNERFSISCTNHWPEKIKEKIGTEKKIGNSSGTIHAETACILNAPQATEDASLCITDPFCPNCAKNVAEAGVKTIYIDHKGFDKDFFKRRGEQFDTMSMQICEHAGISVYELRREDEKLVPILEVPYSYIPPEDSPIDMQPILKADDTLLRQLVQKAEKDHSRRKFAIALARDNDSALFSLVARAHAVRGYSMSDPDEALDLLTPIGKYSFIQEPVNRTLMFMARRGLKPEPGYFYCSQVPTSREQVNLVGAGIKRITVGDFQRCRDPHGREAMRQLKDAGILRYN